jgi:tetratricopeptide (TPR) repeat protein
MGYPDKKAAVVYFANGMEGLSIAKDVMGMFISKDQPSLDYLGYDSVESVDIDIFSRALKSPVAEALTPYFVPGSTIVDTNKVAIGIINYLGNRFMELHEYDKSIDFFNAGIRANPTLGKLYGGLGESYLRLGRRAEAIVAFEKAASIDTAVKAYGKLINKLRHIAPAAQEGKKLITFKLPEYMYARTVSLAGSFNDWNDVTEPMTWENGAWTITIPLRKGSYKYKFVVDGVWLTDVRNPKFSKDSFDSELTVE